MSQPVVSDSIPEKKTVTIPIICSNDNDSLEVVTIRIDVWEKLTKKKIDNNFAISCTRKEVIGFFKELENYEKIESPNNNQVLNICCFNQVGIISDVCAYYEIAEYLEMSELCKIFLKIASDCHPIFCFQLLNSHNHYINQKICNVLDTIVIDSVMSGKYFNNYLSVEVLTNGQYFNDRLLVKAFAIREITDLNVDIENLEDNLVKLMLNYFAHKYHVVTHHGIHLFESCMERIFTDSINKFESFKAIITNIHFSHIKSRYQSDVQLEYKKRQEGVKPNKMRRFAKIAQVKAQAKKQALAEMDDGKFISADKFYVDGAKFVIGSMLEVKDMNQNWFMGRIINWGKVTTDQERVYAIISFNGWSEKWNECVLISSKRFAEPGTFTDGSTLQGVASRNKFGDMLYSNSDQAAFVEIYTKEILAEQKRALTEKSSVATPTIVATPTVPVTVATPDIPVTTVIPKIQSTITATPTIVATPTVPVTVATLDIQSTITATPTIVATPTVPVIVATLDIPVTVATPDIQSTITATPSTIDISAPMVTSEQVEEEFIVETAVSPADTIKEESPAKGWFGGWW